MIAVQKEASAVREYQSLWSYLPIGAYIILLPFYLMPPSMPQMADVVMLLIAIGTLLGTPRKYEGRFKEALIVLGVFATYTFIVNGIFAVGLSDLSVLRSSLYYLFNLIGFATIVQQYLTYGEKFLRFVATMVAVSLCLQLALGVISGGLFLTGDRQVLFFNNPNQLGYWTLLSLALIGLALTRIAMPRILSIVAFVGGLVIISLSLSKAALAGAAVLLVLVGIRRPLVLAIVLAMAFAASTTSIGGGLVESVTFRVESAGNENDNSLEGRFYDRIFDNPQFWLFGSGEGAYERWAGGMEDEKEIHSTFGSIFFCYGLLGSILLFWSMLRIVGRNWTAWMFVLPIALYSLTHNGIRFTTMWLFLSFASCYTHLIASERRALQARGNTGQPSPLLPSSPVPENAGGLVV